MLVNMLHSLSQPLDKTCTIEDLRSDSNPDLDTPRMRSRRYVLVECTAIASMIDRAMVAPMRV